MLSPILVDAILFFIGLVFGRYLGFIFRLTSSYIDYFIRLKINKFFAIFLGFFITIFVFSSCILLIFFLLTIIGRDNLTKEGKFILFFGIFFGVRFFTYKSKKKLDQQS
jgi:hypothetical protein